MRLLQLYLRREVPTLNSNNIRLQYIGRQHELPPQVQERMQWAREATEKNTGMVLTLALNYSARSELVDAFNAMVKAAASNGGIDHLRVDEEAVSRHLYTRHLPDPVLPRGWKPLGPLPKRARSLRFDVPVNVAPQRVGHGQHRAGMQ